MHRTFHPRSAQYRRARKKQLPISSFVAVGEGSYPVVSPSWAAPRSFPRLIWGSGRSQTFGSERANVSDSEVCRLRVRQTHTGILVVCVCRVCLSCESRGRHTGAGGVRVDHMLAIKAFSGIGNQGVRRVILRGGNVGSRQNGDALYRVLGGKIAIWRLVVCSGRIGSPGI